jgi:uncharacterized protein YndB with AHSA1/START domain
MIGTRDQIDAIQRTVRRTAREDGGENVTVLARRTYAADVDDTWSALTDPSRIARWFMPIKGDLRVGGRFQVEGNAEGEILECDPPRRLRVTYGGETSLVEVRLSPDGDRATTLELEHTVPIEMAQSGAGALWVGPGWDSGLQALADYLGGEFIEDPTTAASSPERLAFGERSVHAWAAAVKTSGTATEQQLSEAVEMSLAQFGPSQD